METIFAEINALMDLFDKRFGRILDIKRKLNARNMNIEELTLGSKVLYDGVYNATVVGLRYNDVSIEFEDEHCVTVNKVVSVASLTKAEPQEEIVIRRSIYNTQLEHKLVHLQNDKWLFKPAEGWMPVYLNYDSNNRGEKIISIDSDGFGIPLFVGDRVKGDKTSYEVTEFSNDENGIIVHLKETTGDAKSPEQIAYESSVE